MRKNINFKMVVLAIFIVGQTYGQTVKPSKKSIQEVAEKSMNSKNYYDAYIKYKELLEFEENNISYLYSAAEASRLFGSTAAFADAIKYYDLVLKHENNNSYPLASLHMGRVKQMMGDYQGAKMSYLAYRTEHGNEDEYASSYADKEIKACEWALTQLSKVDTNLKIRRLGDNINSQEWSDFAPSSKDDLLRFSSDRFDNLINKYKPKRTLSKLLTSKGEALAIPVESPNLDFKGMHVSNASFSPDNSRTVFTVCKDTNDHDIVCQLYKAKIDAQGNWSEVAALPDFINVPNATNTHPCISVDPKTNKETLYFVSNREGGKGMLDIWYSMVDESGSYSEPMNLGSLNTREDDITPFYDGESSTLYFSSRGYLGFGGFDLFSSKKNGTAWATPVNLGSPRNSSYDDIYYTLNNGRKGYFSSNRKVSKISENLDEVCCLDIYQVDLPKCEAKLKVLVYDVGTKEELKGVKLTITEVGNNSATPIVISFDKGSDISTPLDCDKEYKIVTEKDCYGKDSVMVLSGRPGEFTVILKKIELRKEYNQLNVLTYDSESGAELKGASISLFDLNEPSKAAVNITSGVNANLIPCHKYRIVANSPGYGEATQEFSVDCNAPCTTIVRKIYFETYLVSLLPVCLYFDNDIPRQTTGPKTTSQTYSQTYKSYYARKAEYIRRSLKLGSSTSSTSTYTSYSDCNCGASDSPIYNIRSGSPKVLTRLGTNPEFGNLHNLSTAEVLAKFKKAAKDSKRDRDFLNKAFKGLGFSSFEEVSLSNISEVVLPKGIVGNIGYSKDHQTTYVQLNNEAIDLSAFRFSGPSGCDLHFMKTCGNHFYYCTGKEITTYKETTNFSSGCVITGTDMDGFFENNVRAGKEKFNVFLDSLAIELAEGKEYKIDVRGYTSPLAQNDYNLNLSKRRIKSIQNEFAKYKGGILSKYIKSKKLVIEESPLGEDTAPSGVPFDPKDPRSIYTVDAASERRIEIINIDKKN
ncbi:MAG: hypothetical protein HOP11_01920 [Saprospiraceae bacterium]|nr:hypothetical protein [Saprospiraceae bacterium]